MKRFIDYSVIALAIFAIGWLLFKHEMLSQILQQNTVLYVATIFGFYLLSHLFRMMRLAILTLERRELILALPAAHGLTALPASLFPMKLGEILRLASFFVVCGDRTKALAVWLVERFMDVIVLCSLISVLYIANVDVSENLKLIFIVFFVAASLAVLTLFAIAKVFIFINQYLVLSSYTRRGLALLKISHSLRQIELEILKSVLGRMSGLILLSVAIWLTEILVIFIVLGTDSIKSAGISEYFVVALSGIVFGDFSEFNGIYGLSQTLGLIFLVLLCAVIILSSRIFRGVKN